jgi:uncharacterized protein involved in exopolysaccharide biosynthesis
MGNRDQLPVRIFEVVHVLRRHFTAWAVPAAVIAVLGIVHASFRGDTWEASQAVLVRNDAVARPDGPGKFRDSGEMKTTQETILEIARSNGVLEKVLLEVGPAADTVASEAWPSPRDVADFQSAIRLTPPKGAEFGKTEVLYVKVKAESQQRALALVSSLCRHLDLRLGEIRESQAEGIINELERAVALAEADRQAATLRLAQVEAQAGGDLAELRNLEELASGDTDLRRKVTEIENELRQARLVLQGQDELLTVLRAAEDNPQQIVATPNALLATQPVLRRLKDGLVDAQLRTSQLLGTMSEQHPQVVAARASEQAVSDTIQKEVASAIRGLEIDRRLTKAQVESLDGEWTSARERLTKLAALRAEYSNVAHDAAQASDHVDEARRNLAEARARAATAKSGSPIARIDAPTTGPKPVGPGRITIGLASIAGGLLSGFGILFLVVPAGGAAAERNGHPRRAVPSTSNGSACELSLKDALSRVNGAFGRGL